jgi:hypothetical protein
MIPAWQTELLAQWLYESWASTPHLKAQVRERWPAIPEDAKAEYRQMAARLLTEPPEVLVFNIKGLTPKR